MQIIELTASNVKRLKAVKIVPKGAVINLGGENEAGKSSVLDSIQMALGGEPSESMPVRKGEEKAVITVNLGDLVVRRTITPDGGGTLTVTDADGLKKSSPQTILDRLTGRLTFDPLEFSRQKPKVQAETLRQIVGLDLSALDARRAEAYDRRTAVGKNIKECEARLAAQPHHEGLPAKPIVTADILTAQAEAARRNQENERTRWAARRLDSEAMALLKALDHERTSIEQLKQEIINLQASVDRRTAEYDQTKAAVQVKVRAAADAMDAAGEIVDEPLNGFVRQLTDADRTNRLIGENMMRQDVVEVLKTRRVEHETLTEEIDRIDSEKARAIREAKYPIDGLGFDVNGVTLDGIPFSQSSSAQQLKVSVAIGLALNPSLRVLLIRDGSLLDEKSLAMLGQMAEKAGAQVWVERVGVDDHTSVVIEDGQAWEVTDPTSTGASAPSSPSPA